MRAILRPAVLSLLAAIVGCADLPSIPRGTCGNGIFEPDLGEECDGFPQGGCGLPGTAAACRFACSSGDNAVSCPTGFTCGGDGLCRQPSGRFEFVSRPSSSPAYTLQQGDFDGDGRADLVSRGGDAVVVHFGDAASPFTFAWMLEPATPAAVTSLSSDSLSDLVHISDIGISVLRGTESRTFLPTPYSSMPVPSGDASLMAIDARPKSLAPSSWTGFKFEGDEVVTLALRSLDVRWPDNSPLFQLPVGLGEVKSAPVAGDLFEDPILSPCTEIAVAVGSTVQVLTPCRHLTGGEYDWNHDIGALQAVSAPGLDMFPAGTPLLLQLFDVNRDHHLDIVIVGDMGMMVAYGLGDGRFHSKVLELGQDGLVPDQQMSFTEDKYAGIWGFLAFGHLNDDSIPDLITTYSIMMSTGMLGQEGAYQTVVVGDGSWSEAIVADLNGNGLDDVLIASNGMPDFAFFNNAGNGKLNHFEVRTDGLPTMMKLGDFDGDLLLDVAFRERKAVQTGNTPSQSYIDSLSIVFGKAFGAPEGPVSGGELGEVMQIIPGNIGATYQDAITDLMVLNQAASATSPSIAIFPGASSRQLQSPLRLELDGTSRIVPSQVVAGRFDGDSASHQDLAVLASMESAGGREMSSEVRMWLLPSTGDAAMDPATFSASQPLPQSLNPWSLMAASMDLDKDGTDEVIVLGQGYTEMAQMGAVIVMRAHKEGGKSVLVADPMLTTDEFFSLEGGMAPVGGSSGTKGDDTAGFPSEMMMLGSVAKTVDIDGDGLIDLAATATWYPTGGQDPFYMPEQRLVIMRNNGNGTLEVAGRLSLTAPGGRQVSGFAFAQMDTDPEQEVVMLTFDAAWVMDIDLAGKKAGEPKQLPGVSGGNEAASVDYDADGVQDLVIGKGDGLFLYRGVPVR